MGGKGEWDNAERVDGASWGGGELPFVLGKGGIKRERKS